MTAEPDLSQLRIFEGVNAEDIRCISGDMTRMKFDASSTILHEGKMIQALWVILEGRCLVTRSGRGQEDCVLANLEAGDVFGEMSFVRTAPHSATIRAVSDTTVCCYTREDFFRLGDQSPSAAFRISLNIASVLAERLRRMDNWMCDLAESPDGIEYRNEWQEFRSAVYTNWSLK